MKIFLTGASGLIGRSTTAELLRHGHSVLALSRSTKSNDILTSLGATPHAGSLEDLDALRSGAANADAAIHLGFIHDDFSEEGLKKAQAVDRAAITAIAEALNADGKGSGKPFVVAAGTFSVEKNADGVCDEDCASNSDGSAFGERMRAGQMLVQMSKDGKVKGMVMRFAPTVHGPGDWGLIPIAIKLMKGAGKAVYVGENGGVWPACHVEDAAVLLRLAVEKGRSGATYHAVGEGGVSMKSVAELVGKRTGLEVVSMDQKEAVEKLQFIGGLLGYDGPVESVKTQKELGWTPSHAGLLEDMELNYF